MTTNLKLVHAPAPKKPERHWVNFKRVYFKNDTMPKILYMPTRSFNDWAFPTERLINDIAEAFKLPIDGSTLIIQDVNGEKFCLSADPTNDKQIQKLKAHIKKANKKSIGLNVGPSNCASFRTDYGGLTIAWIAPLNVDKRATAKMTCAIAWAFMIINASGEEARFIKDRHQFKISSNNCLTAAECNRATFAAVNYRTNYALV